MQKERILGYVIGQAEGWDGDSETFTLDNFQPAPWLKPHWPDEATQFQIDTISGVIEAWVPGEDDARATFRWRELIVHYHD